MSLALNAAVSNLIAITLFSFVVLDSGFALELKAESEGIQAILQLATHARVVGADILKAFPPESHFIINYGPPTALTGAYFREVIPDAALRRDYYRELMMIKEEGASNLDSEKLLFSLLESILPTQRELRGRTVVIHRYLWAGSTLEWLAKELHRYIYRRRPDLVIKFALVTTSQDKDYLSFFLQRLAADVLLHSRFYFKTFIQTDDSRRILQQLAETQFVYQRDLQLGRLTGQVSQRNPDVATLSELESSLRLYDPNFKVADANESRPPLFIRGRRSISKRFLEACVRLLHRAP